MKNKLLKIKYYIFNPSKFILKMMNSKLSRILSDKIYLKIYFRCKMGYKLNLKNPQTFNEKLQWIKLYDRKPEYTKMVDKYEVRKYVKEKIGEEYLIPLIGVYDKFDDVDFSKLPNQFVIKCNHDSGGLVICKDKSKLNIEDARKKINKSLKTNYYYFGREWPYKNVKPRIIIEKYIEDLTDDDLKDYKLFVFNEKFAYSFVCSERKTDLKFTFFDRNGKFINMTQDDCPYDKNIKLPNKYNEMVKLAEKIAVGTIESRIDFYEVNNKIYFGEITFFDSGGFGKFEPKEYDLKIGKMLKLPSKNKNRKNNINSNSNNNNNNNCRV